MPVRAPIQGVNQPVLPIVVVVQKDEASFFRCKPNYACPLALPLKRQIRVRPPVLSAIDRGIQIGTIIVVTPGEEPAAQLIEKEEVSYTSGVLRSSRSGFFPIPTPIDSSEYKKILSVSPVDPPKLRCQEKQAIDESDVSHLGFHPRMASIVRTKERFGQGSVPAAVINHLHPLQFLLRHVLPM